MVDGGSVPTGQGSDVLRSGTERQPVEQGPSCGANGQPLRAIDRAEAGTVENLARGSLQEESPALCALRFVGRGQGGR